MFFEILWKIMQERLERKSQKSIRESLDTSFINDCKYKINLYFSDFQVPVRAVYLFEKIHIYVDKKFYYKFSTKELELIILHEVGHFKVSKFKKYLSLYLFSTLLCASVIVQYTYHGFTISLVMSIEIVLFLIYFFYNYLNRKDEYFADRYANTNKRNHDVNMIDVLKKGYKVYKKFPYQYSLHNKLWSKHPTLMQRIISMQ
jgi:Zn-dependent protease with chaperone function